MSVVVKDAHGLRAYYHDCVMSEEDRIDENGEPVNYVYAKLKADKVIAHNKYKRCVAMAKWCLTERVYFHYRYDDWGDKGYDRPYKWKKVVFWGKWARRWLELAEKFKEAK